MNKILLLPILVSLLAGCVNLHVHFPEAAPEKAAGSDVPEKAAPASGAASAPAGEAK